MIIVLDKGRGRVDGGLSCETCGRVGLWQPNDMDPCADAWWCKICRSWSNDPLEVHGKHARCVAGNHRGRSSGRGETMLAYREIVPVCTCDCAWPVRWCHEFISIIQSWYLRRK